MDSIIYICITTALVAVLIYIIIARAKTKEMASKLNNIRGVQRLKTLLYVVDKKQLIKSKYAERILNVKAIIYISVIMYIISFLVIFLIIKIVSTSVILALPLALSPQLIIRYLVSKEKNQILNQLPTYIVNLKSQIQMENNIVLAIKRVKCTQPLEKYTKMFIQNVEMGMNVIDAFDKLKQDVSIKEFSVIISSFEACYRNGGDFLNLLDKYGIAISKKLYEKEQAKEKTYSSLVTLGIMFALNIILLITFTFQNAEYSQIMRDSIGGRLILDINALPYMLVGYSVLNVYKMEV